MAESTDTTEKPKSSSSSPKLAPNRTKDFGAAAEPKEKANDSPSITLAEGDDESDSDGGISSSTSSSSSSSSTRPPGGGPPRSTTAAALSRSVSENHDGIETRRDPEMGEPIEEKTTTTAPDPNDPNLVTWTGPDDPDNPKTWAYSKKWRAVVIVSMFTFMSPVSSSLVAPSLTAIGDELGVPPGTEQALILSIFVLAYAIGPLLWGPLSELYGRIVVLQVTNLVFLFFNLGCGFAKTKAQIIVFRFFAGLGGSAPLAIGGGVLADLFTAEERGRAMAIYSLAPLLGPAVGPIAGAFITEYTTWRWSFWATTLADAAIQGLGLLLLRETYGPVLLTWRRRRLTRETGNAALRTPYDDPDRTVAQLVRQATARPFRLLGTQVIVQVLALYMMYLYGLMYIVLVSFPALFSGPPPAGYGEPVGLGGLNYLSLGLGFFLGSQTCARLQDRVYAALKRRQPGGAARPGRPEFRVPMMVPGAVLVPVGLLIYGWTAEYKTHWIGPNIGACLFSAGTIVGFQCVQTFLVDTYTRYAASAVGAATVMRSLAGFGFPLFADSLYARLGLGWGNTLLAFVGVAIGWSAPALLWFYGETLRKKSPFAAGPR